MFFLISDSYIKTQNTAHILGFKGISIAPNYEIPFHYVSRTLWLKGALIVTVCI